MASSAGLPCGLTMVLHLRKLLRACATSAAALLNLLTLYGR